MFGWNICTVGFRIENLLGVKSYLREELDHWGFVGVFFTELQGQLEGSVLRLDG